MRRLGFDVVRAVDGEEAVRLASPVAPLESRPFDVILMDLKMPGLDGYEATRRLRRLEAACGWSPTPIVALTANAFDGRKGSPSAAGFDAFLVKPVEFGALAGTVGGLRRLGGAVARASARVVASSRRGAPSARISPRLLPASDAQAPRASFPTIQIPL